jgi:hypothetical protein
MSGMLELGSSRCLNLTAEFKFEKNRFKASKMAVCSHLNFCSNFGGFSRRFFVRTALFYLNPVRALVIEKRVKNLKRLTDDCLFQR